MKALGGPPVDLTGFPVYRLTPDRRLFRIHSAVHGPWWFSGSGSGRFDLSPPHGTCYVAENATGAFVEAFQDPGVLIPAEYVGERRLSVLSVPRVFDLADCTASQSRGFGVTAEIHSTVARQTTQSWARAFARSSFVGIRFFLRHDPAQRQIGFALFGPAGEPGWPVLSTGEIGADLIQDVEHRFGIRVEP